MPGHRNATGAVPVGFAPVLAYVFWHVPAAGVAAADYEARLDGVPRAPAGGAPAGLGADGHGRARRRSRGWAARRATRTGTSSRTSPRSARSTRPPCRARARRRTTPRRPRRAAGVAGRHGPRRAARCCPSGPGWAAWLQQAGGHGLRRVPRRSWRTRSAAPAERVAAPDDARPRDGVLRARGRGARRCPGRRRPGRSATVVSRLS